MISTRAQRYFCIFLRNTFSGRLCKETMVKISAAYLTALTRMLYFRKERNVSCGDDYKTASSQPYTERRVTIKQ